MSGGGRVRRVWRRGAVAAMDALPPSVVRRGAGVIGPLARLTARTGRGAQTLRRTIELLTEPPRPMGAPGPHLQVDELAGLLGRPVEDIRDWVRRGLLGVMDADGALPPHALDHGRTVAYLERHGVPDGDIDEASRQNRMALLVVDRALAGAGGLTAADVARRSRVPPALVERIWRALGMPVGVEPRFGQRDVDAVRILGALRGIYDDDQLVELVSVLGRAMAQVASAHVESFRQTVASRWLAAGSSRLDISLRMAALADLLVPLVDVLLGTAYRHHLETATRSETVLRVEEMTGVLPDHERFLVGFADLAGFTAASERLSPRELGELSASLLRVSEKVLPVHRTTIVKSIGDAVMFSARAATDGAAGAVALVAAAAEAQLPGLHVGLCYGPALRRHADLFGRTVNVASRLCGLAGSGEVLITWPVEGTGSDEWIAAGLSVGEPRSATLKGLDVPVDVAQVRSVSRSSLGS